MGSQFNAEAEAFNAYIHAYGKHNKNVIVLEKLLHPNEQRGVPILNDLLNVEVE